MSFSPWNESKSLSTFSARRLQTRTVGGGRESERAYKNWAVEYHLGVHQRESLVRVDGYSKTGKNQLRQRLWKRAICISNDRRQPHVEFHVSFVRELGGRSFLLVSSIRLVGVSVFSMFKCHNANESSAGWEAVAATAASTVQRGAMMVGAPFVPVFGSERIF